MTHLRIYARWGFKIMKIKLSLLLASFIALSALASKPAQATDYLTLGAGDFNLFRKTDHSIWYGAQYRSNYIWDKFLVNLGVGANTDGGIYGFAGGEYDWNLFGGFYMLPGFAVGAYSQGSSKNLGGTLEFKSSIELDYQFANSWRAGVALWHISNAGIYSHNAGTEVVEGTVSIPFNSLIGGF